MAQMLPEKPRGVGRPIADRRAWQHLIGLPAFQGVVKRAERLMKEPIPELTDDLYLDFSRTGNRTRYQRVLGQRHSRMPRLVLAECIENRGRFLPAIEESIRAIASEKTWVYPAHDRRLHNFNGTVREIDLSVAYVSWNLATADFWLGDKLSADVRKLIRDELEKRTFEPFEGTMTENKPKMWWPRCTSNWNAVCLAGTTGAALASIESRERRAFFLASAEECIRNFLQGFTPDGYCTEGLGYWNYGFGHFVMLAETVLQATGGKVDMFAYPKVAEVARFGVRMELAPGIYPAFADCSVRARPNSLMTAFLNRRFDLGLADVRAGNGALPVGPSTRLFELGLLGFENSVSGIRGAEVAKTKPLRDWFPDAAILVCRPAAGDGRALAVALKGGHNAEHHNHNDVGSFVVALGGQTPLLDPGGEIYTARTFSGRRYESGVLNSFGHPVPRVAGKLQRRGRAAAAKVVKTQFTDKTDTLVLDVSSAYDVKELKKLQRTFVYSREGASSLTVIDDVEFTSPRSLGTALVTFSKWRQPESNRLVIGQGESAVRVEIAVSCGEIELKAERIEEDLSGGRVPTRLGIDLKKPVAKTTITLSITPAPKPG